MIFRYIQFKFLGQITRSISSSQTRAYPGTNRPPNQCIPLNSLTPSFGTVRLMSVSGVNVSTTSTFPFSSGTVSSFCLPRSTSHPEGISTEMIGTEEELRRVKIRSNGRRRGGRKEKPINQPWIDSDQNIPNIASRMTSVSASPFSSSSTVLKTGICKFLHCVRSLWYMSFEPGLGR